MSRFRSRKYWTAERPCSLPGAAAAGTLVRVLQPALDGRSVLVVDRLERILDPLRHTPGFGAQRRELAVKPSSGGFLSHSAWTQARLHSFGEELSERYATCRGSRLGAPKQGIG